MSARTLGAGKAGGADGALAVQADGVLFAVSPPFLRSTEIAIRTSRAWGTETWMPGKSIIFMGLELVVGIHHVVSISKNHYIDELYKINPDQYAEQGVV